MVLQMWGRIRSVCFSFAFEITARQSMRIFRGYYNADNVIVQVTWSRVSRGNRDVTQLQAHCFPLALEITAWLREVLEELV
jgi:hypothetical protein